MDDPLWLPTEEVCRRLAISRTTLFQLRRQGLLKDGRHVVAKNPGCRRSDLLWHQGRCSALLAGAHARSPRAMAESLPSQAVEPAGDYVLLHRKTGTAGYATAPPPPRSTGPTSGCRGPAAPAAM